MCQVETRVRKAVLNRGVIDESSDKCRRSVINGGYDSIGRIIIVYFLNVAATTETYTY